MTALLIIFVTKLSSAFLLYLFQNSSVSMLEPVWEIMEEDLDDEDDEDVELENDNALDLNDDVASFNVGFLPSLSRDLMFGSSSKSVL